MCAGSHDAIASDTGDAGVRWALHGSSDGDADAVYMMLMLCMRCWARNAEKAMLGAYYRRPSYWKTRVDGELTKTRAQAITYVNLI